MERSTKPLRHQPFDYYGFELIFCQRSAPQRIIPMELVAIESSMIQAVSYDEEDRTLLVLFNSGKAYRYFDVPQRLYKDLLDSDSRGRFMLDRVIGHLPYRFAKKARKPVAKPIEQAA
jgi:hypothetical protein